MRVMIGIVSFAALACSVLAILLYKDTAQPRSTVPSARAQLELSYHMGHIERFTEKLWLAGTNGNEELAAFYVERLKSVIGEISSGSYYRNDIELSELIDVMLGDPLDGVVESVAKGDDAFRSKYAEVIDACNDCHGVSDVDEVVITLPETQGGPIQDFTR